MATTDTKTFNLRMPPELRAWLDEEARKNFRSLNSEIIFKLQESRGKCAVPRRRNPGQRPV
jgi:predicted HicB family RNase H-like nuclease